MKTELKKPVIIFETDFEKSWNEFKCYMRILELNAPSSNLVKTMEDIEKSNTKTIAVK